MNEFFFEIRISATYVESLELLAAALNDEGFGVQTEIDAKETFKRKIDVDFRQYKIIGACNPTLAHNALSSTPEIGLLLP